MGGEWRTLGQNLVILRSVADFVYPPFLRWLLRSPAWWDQVRKFTNVGAVFESLKCADIPNFRLPLPPLREQQAIACILGALDAKIELNRRMNRTLESMARSIFKSWFVDFDPVRAKAAGQPPRQVGWGSTEYIVLRPRGVIPPVFAYLLARTDDFRSFAIQQMTGSSGRQRVPADSLSKFRIATPDVDSELFQRFANLTVPMFSRITATMMQSRTLAALRDTLLPKLISGELRVPDAERIVGRVV